MNGTNIRAKAGLWWLGVMVLGSMAGGMAADAETSVPRMPHFQEVLRLLRGQLEGVTEEALNRAMVEGMLQAFNSRVVLLTNGLTLAQAEGTPLISREQVYPGGLGYVRIHRVEEGLPDDLRGAVGGLQSTNDLRGLILDLRFADGLDYRAAAEAANAFAPSVGQVLLRWGEDEHLVTAGAKLPMLPMTVLVNHETSRGAEALAAALREGAAALLMGRRTAGEAFAAEVFDLSSDDKLWIASKPVEVGESKSLVGGVVPDISVEVRETDERGYFEDAYHVPAELARETGLTNRPRVNEAELVRLMEEKNRGVAPPPSSASSVSETGAKPLRDPVLVRALDVLRGIIVVTEGKSR